LREAIQDKTVTGRREKKEDKRKKQGQAAQQQESLLGHQNMIRLADLEEQERREPSPSSPSGTCFSAATRISR
jgi:hypothetical protein